MSKRVRNFSTDTLADGGLSLTLDYEGGDSETISVPQDIVPLLMGQLMADSQRLEGDPNEAKNALRVENVLFGSAVSEGQSFIALKFRVQGGAQLLTILPEEGAEVLSRELGKYVQDV